MVQIMDDIRNDVFLRNKTKWLYYCSDSGRILKLIEI